MPYRRHVIPKKNIQNKSIWPEDTVSIIGNLTTSKNKFILFFITVLILSFLVVVFNKNSINLDPKDSSSDVSNTIKKNNREIISLQNPTSQNQKELNIKNNINLYETKKIISDRPSEKLKHIYEEIITGDNLSKVFKRAGLGDTDLINIMNSSPEGKELNRMLPGEKLEFILNLNNQLIEIIRHKSILEIIHFKKNENSINEFIVKTIIKQPEKKIIYRSAKIKDSLSLSAEQAEISATTTMNMAKIFGGVIDFVLDVRNGDTFTVAYEGYYLDGEKINDGYVVAAQYVNKGKIYNAFRYTDPDGDTGYFNEHGVSMRKAFLRAPLDFTRVSSGFNMRRLHPITKQVKPHRGIDYAAPTGTPIFSTGDGRVIESAYNNTNGHYIFIRHGESYVTKYLHLHKRNVSKGQKVTQSQIIGQVGSTGLSTGPHLHYEFLVDGIHHNPSTILKKLPKAKHLNPSFKKDFLDSISHSKIQLEKNFKNYTDQ